MNVIKCHTLNMKLDLQSLFRLHVHSCSHWLLILAPIRGRYVSMVSQERRHLFVTRDVRQGYKNI